MIEMITPKQFKKIPWKNGKGETIELAISENGTLDHFDWRVSMASVVENGPFSDFSGYQRHLILIQGNGMTLTHNGSGIDELTNLLSIATFDGSNVTSATLHQGAITDFNLMTSFQKFKSRVNTYNKPISLILKQSELCFLYSLDSHILIENKSDLTNFTVPAGHLVKVSEMSQSEIVVCGNNLIIGYLNKR